jgi:hypothetical protein
LLNFKEHFDMKKIVFFSAICLAVCAVFAQQAPPQAIKYQAVVRDIGNAVVTDGKIDIEVHIRHGVFDGPTVYAEKHEPVNNQGLINFDIGRGTKVSGIDFDKIDWGAGPYFVMLMLQINNTGYTHMSTSQLLSVPYALYAEKARFAENGGGGGIPYDLTNLTIPLFVDSNGDSLVDSKITQNAAGEVVINGVLNINNVYRFPTTAGSNGQVLVLRGNDLEWEPMGGGTGPATADTNWNRNGNDLRNKNSGNVVIGGGETFPSTETRGIYWSAEKQAFRAGFNDFWNIGAWGSPAVGENSIGLGTNIYAGSKSSFAIGRDLRVNNWGADGVVFAIGSDSWVDDGDNSFSVGIDNEIENGISSMTIGAGNKIEGMNDNLYVNIIGNDNRVESSDNITVLGGQNMVRQAENSLILGINNGSESNRIQDIQSGFIFGERNIVQQTTNSLVLGQENTLDLRDRWNGNDLAVVIGKRNNLIGTGAMNNVVMGMDNSATGSSNILIGSDNDSKDNSIYIGYNNTEGTFGDDTKAHNVVDRNIALGRDIDFNGLAQNTIAIGQRIQGLDNTFNAFTHHSTVNIGNDIWPMRNANYSINIGNLIQTRSDSSINIGYNIKSIHPRGYQTINIGRNITNDGPDMSVSGANAIAIGDNISITNAPYSINIGNNIVYGKRSPQFYNTGAIVLGGMDTVFQPYIPQFPYTAGVDMPFRSAGFVVKKANARMGVDPYLIYIDAVGNAFFGFGGGSAGSPSGLPTLYSPPPAGDFSNGIPANARSGTVYARQFYSVTGSGFLTVSDRRLKRNIHLLRADYTDYLYKIRPFSFNYDLEGSDKQQIHWGFMAQDVQRWFPHLVDGSEETSMALNYGGFIPILWKINQDQQIKIDEQQSRIEELERQIETNNDFNTDELRRQRRQIAELEKKIEQILEKLNEE